MFYRNSQGNIINLDNVREIVKRVNSAVYDIQKVDAFAPDNEDYKVLEWLDDPKTLNEFMDWLWGQIHDEFSTCSFDEFTKKTVKYAPLKR